MVISVFTDTDIQGAPRLSMRYGFYDWERDRNVEVFWHSSRRGWWRYVEFSVVR